MESSELTEFARVLVCEVRDRAIQACDQTLQSSAGGPIAQRWRDAAARRSPNDLAKLLIPDVVDSALAHLLGAIDQGLLRLSYTASNGVTVDLTQFAAASGELSGWYSGGEGWCEEYSKERFVDDLADLKDFFRNRADPNASGEQCS